MILQMSREARVVGNADEMDAIQIRRGDRDGHDQKPPKAPSLGYGRYETCDEQGSLC